MPNNDDAKSLDQMHPSKNIQSSGKKPMSVAERNMQAAIERAEEMEAEAKAAQERAEAERKNDGRKYDLEVEGFNIGDSLVRRMEFLNEKAAEAQDAIADEDLEAEVDEVESEDDTDEINEINTAEEQEEADEDLDDEFDFGDDETDDDFGVDSDPEPVPAEKPEDVQRAEKALEGIAKTAAPVEDDDNEEEALSEKPLPSQGETMIDDEDIDDLDLDDTSSDDDEMNVSEEELEQLRDDIRFKISGNLPSADQIQIEDKPVSVNRLLAVDTTNQNAADWPMMNAGVCVSMSRFSGPEIEALNQTITPRNRFNTMKDIYRSLYNHIVSEKPSFEKWLKTTSYMDINHIFMAAYKASFHGANYIPLNCYNCDHVFLTEDMDIEETMVHFKNDEAKKRFYDIKNSTGTVIARDKTKLVVLSNTVAVTLRDPSIYNTVFENAVLDQKFMDKYEKLLTMMVYIDKMYMIDKTGKARPIAVKEDKHSLAKTCKYRIATYAKVINSLPSDGYSTLIAEIAKMNEADDEVVYQLPEVKCPKCGETIEAEIQGAQKLLFNRHRLNLLTAQ